MKEMIKEDHLERIRRERGEIYKEMELLCGKMLIVMNESVDNGRIIMLIDGRQSREAGINIVMDITVLRVLLMDREEKEKIYFCFILKCLNLIFRKWF